MYLEHLIMNTLYRELENNNLNPSFTLDTNTRDFTGFSTLNGGNIAPAFTHIGWSQFVPLVTKDIMTGKFYFNLDVWGELYHRGAVCKFAGKVCRVLEKIKEVSDDKGNYIYTLSLNMGDFESRMGIENVEHERFWRYTIKGSFDITGGKIYK